MVTLVTAEKNCFQELFKAIRTVRISMFIWQQVPDCRADSRIRAKSTQRGTARRFRLADRRRRRRGAASEAGMRWSARYRGAPSCRHRYTITPSLCSILSEINHVNVSPCHNWTWISSLIQPYQTHNININGPTRQLVLLRLPTFSKVRLCEKTIIICRCLRLYSENSSWLRVTLSNVFHIL